MSASNGISAAFGIMGRISRRWIARDGVFGVTLLLLLTLVHFYIVGSTVFSKQAIIWPLHNDTVHRMGRGADFFAIYHAGLKLRRHEDPYDSRRDGVTPDFYDFRYLSIVAIAAQPLTLLRPYWAYGVWVFFIECLMAFGLIVLWRSLPDRSVRLAALSLLLINSPYFLELYMGQFTFVTVALCCLAVILPWGQPLFWISVLLKPLTLAAFPALSLQRRTWSHAAGAIILLLLFTIPYYMRHPHQWDVFYSANFHLSIAGLHSGNFGLVKLIYLVVNDFHWHTFMMYWPENIELLRRVILAITAMLVIFVRRRDLALTVPFLLLAHFLTYQLVWEHHMSAVSFIAAFMLTSSDRRAGFTIIVLLALLFLAMPTPFGLLDVNKDPTLYDPFSRRSPHYREYIVLLPKVIPTVLLYLCCLWALLRDGFARPWTRHNQAPAAITERIKNYC